MVRYELSPDDMDEGTESDAEITEANLDALRDGALRDRGLGKPNGLAVVDGEVRGTLTLARGALGEPLRLEDLDQVDSGIDT